MLASQPDSFPVTMRCSLHIITVVFIIANFTAAQKQQYELVGRTVQLSLGNHQQNLTHLKWKKDKIVIAVIDKASLIVKNPEVYNVDVTNGSLFIKNVTRQNSGFYEAIIDLFEEQTTKYHLTVEEPVLRPVIYTDILQLNFSTNVCRISVTCSAKDDAVMYDCNFQICRIANTSLTKHNITVSLTHSGLVECTASNHVSTNKTAIHVIHPCLARKDGPVLHHSNALVVLAIAISCGLVGILAVCLIIVRWYYSRKRFQNEEKLQECDITTIYSEVCKPQAPKDNNSAATTVYDVPSKAVRAPEGLQMLKTTQAPPPVDKTVTAGTRKEEEPENDALTVYWKLGQKHNQ
ncbi:hypothetical protein NFI96_030390 [Prochilodus magdalenae]|nr:hypothetical protein NFI96_030390 [Prochilodus magdalenae]